MMRIALRLVALSLLFLLTAAAVPNTGELAPDFTLSDQRGTQITLSKLRGKKVVLIFYRAHW